MTPLDYEAKKLLNHIVSKLHTVEVGNPLSYLFYEKVRQELKLPEPNWQLHETPGDVLEAHGLAALAHWTRDSGKPMITGLIVNQSPPRRPSGGYFTLNDSGLPNDDWWLREVQKSVDYDWTNDVSKEVADEIRRRKSPEREFELPEPKDTPKSFDSTDLSAPEGVLVEVYRTLRDTALVRSIKQLHKDRCQICGKTIMLLNDRRYSEGHHIKPLGLKYGGLDKAWNILCVCPTCHVLLDYGAVKIDYEKLHKADGHEVSEEMIDYHNEKLYGKKLAY